MEYGVGAPAVQTEEMPLIQILVITGAKAGCVPVAHLKVMFPVLLPDGTVS